MILEDTIEVKSIRDNLLEQFPDGFFWSSTVLLRRWKLFWPAIGSDIPSGRRVAITTWEIVLISISIANLLRLIQPADPDVLESWILSLCTDFYDSMRQVVSSVVSSIRKSRIWYAVSSPLLLMRLPSVGISG
jgi:hypothetical protein